MSYYMDIEGLRKMFKTAGKGFINCYFVLFGIYNAFMVWGYFAWNGYDVTEVVKFAPDVGAFVCALIYFTFYGALFFFTKEKLHRSLCDKYIAGTFFCVYANALKLSIHPGRTRSAAGVLPVNVWNKWRLMTLPFVIFMPINGFAAGAILTDASMAGYTTEDFILYETIPAVLFLMSSFMYMKFYVLKEHSA